MRWYDYIVCFVFADWMSTDLMNVFSGSTIWASVFHSAMFALGFIAFDSYAQLRKEYINRG